MYLSFYLCFYHHPAFILLLQPLFTVTLLIHLILLLTYSNLVHHHSGNPKLHCHKALPFLYMKQVMSPESKICQHTVGITNINRFCSWHYCLVLVLQVKFIILLWLPSTPLHLLCIQLSHTNKELLLIPIKQTLCGPTPLLAQLILWPISLNCLISFFLLFLSKDSS